MEDNFEKFVRQNRREFDTEEPRDRVWKGIEGGMKTKKTRSRLFYYSAAAGVALLAGIFTWVILAQKPKDNSELVKESGHEVESAENYYTSLIDEKRNELFQQCKSLPDLCKEFEKDLEALNAMYGQLKTEYTKSPDKEVVLKAMMDNLKMQLEILSRQLQILQGIKQKEKEIKKTGT